MTTTCVHDLDSILSSLECKLESLYLDMPDTGTYQITIELTKKYSLLELDLNVFPKTFWQSRDGACFTYGFGSVDSLLIDSPLDINDIVKSKTSFNYFYLSSNFSDLSKAAPLWDGLPKDILIAPEFEFNQSKDHSVLTWNFHYDQKPTFDTLRSRLKSLRIGSRVSASLSATESSYLPGAETWRQDIHEVICSIQAKEFSKIVLARKLELNLTESPSFAFFLSQLLNHSQNTFIYGFQESPESFFLGASPERLLHYKQGKGITEAIAGTSALGSNALEKALFRDELMNSLKDRGEQEWVLTYLKECLEPISKTLDISSLDTIATSNVQHLYQSLDFELKEKTLPSELISLLAPTPAVCGYPKQKAKKMIEERASFPRGLYAGQVGRLSSGEMDLAVSLRCALYREGMLNIFSGVGIVKDSDPEKEWLELNLKDQSLLKLFNLDILAPEY